MPHHSKVILHAVLYNVQCLALLIFESIEVYCIYKLQELF
jgi:hypothetical protein